MPINRRVDVTNAPVTLPCRLIFDVRTAVTNRLMEWTGRVLRMPKALVERSKYNSRQEFGKGETLGRY